MNLSKQLYFSTLTQPFFQEAQDHTLLELRKSKILQTQRVRWQLEKLPENEFS